VLAFDPKARSQIRTTLSL